MPYCRLGHCLKFLLCLTFFLFITSLTATKTYAVCTVSATATCTQNTAECPGAERCPCSEDASKFACRAITAASEQTCSTLRSEGGTCDNICGTSTAQPPSYIEPRINCTQDTNCTGADPTGMTCINGRCGVRCTSNNDCSRLGGGWQCISGECGVINCFEENRPCGGTATCTGERSGQDAGCNYCVTPVLPVCICPAASDVACGAVSNTPTNSPCTGSCPSVVGTKNCPTCTLSANPGTVVSGGSTTITWTTGNSPATCTASGDWNS